MSTQAFTKVVIFILFVQRCSGSDDLLGAAPMWLSVIIFILIGFVVGGITGFVIALRRQQKMIRHTAPDLSNQLGDMASLSEHCNTPFFSSYQKRKYAGQNRNLCLSGFHVSFAHTNASMLEKRRPGLSAFLADFREGVAAGRAEA